MTLDEFILKNENNTLDFDKKFGNQCVDLYRYYLKDVLNFSQSPAVKSAKDIWKNYLLKDFLAIKYSGNNFPQKGDVVIWGESYGVDGHIAICLSGNLKSFICFSQNDPVSTPCIQKKYSSYKGVIGFLRPRGGIIDQMSQWLKQMFLEINIDLEKPESQIRGLIQDVIDGYKKYGELQKRIDQLNKDLAFNAGQAAEFEERLIIVERERNEAREEIEDLKNSMVKRDSLISELNQKISSLQSQFNTEKVVVLSKEEYSKLISKNGLNAYSIGDMLRAILKRILTTQRQ